MVKKAQIISLDLVVAGFVFFILIAVLLTNWNNIIVKINNKQQYDQTQVTAIRVIDILIKTQGKPVDWEGDISSVERIGLANNDRNLSANKVDGLLDLDYNTTISLLNMHNYDFNLNITNKTYGIKEPEKKDIVSIKRKVVYENKERTILVKLWRK